MHERNSYFIVAQKNGNAKAKNCAKKVGVCSNSAALKKNIYKNKIIKKKL